MFDKFTEQFQKSMAPVSELAAVNAKALEQLTQKQSTLFTTLLNDGVAYSQELSKQTDLNGVVESQKKYVANVQEVVVDAAKEAYEIISAAQEKAGEVFRTSVEQAQASVAEAAKGAK